MNILDEKKLCRTPTPGKQPTRIHKWKYDLLRSKILEVVPAVQPGIEFRQLPRRVSATLNPQQKREIGSVSWYTTVVKLEMEVSGEIERIPGSNPQCLIKNTGD